MPKINESGLAWISEEVRAALRSLKIELDRLLQVTASERAIVLATCLEQIRTISGALSVANATPLGVYASTLQNAMQLWRDSPSSMLPGSVTAVTIATQSLDDFLQAAQEQKILSELVLFDDYQRLAAILQQSVAPIDLWPRAQAVECMRQWQQPQFVQDLAHVSHQRLSAYQHLQADQFEIDVLLLAVLREQKLEAALALQVYCDLCARSFEKSNQWVISALLPQILLSICYGRIKLDVHLKRYLLSSLAWLKARGGPTESSEVFEAASAFFAYIVWQEKHEQAQGSDNYLELDKFAAQANWQIRHGTQYTHVYFDPQARERLAKAVLATDETKKVWSDFCGTQAADSTLVKTTDVALSFDKMGQAIEALHPAATLLSQAFYTVVSNGQLCSKREVQVEVATLLLILSSMLSDIKSSSSGATEKHLHDLVVRLDRLHSGEKLGAFEPWMQQQQQRQDWLEAMNNTTEVLGQKLTEIEGVFERTWLDPNDTSELEQVPSKLQQLSAIARSVKLDDFANAAKPVEAKIRALVQSQAAMDAAKQKELAADLAGLGLILSMWAHKPDGNHPSAPRIELIPNESVEQPMHAHGEVVESEEAIEHVFLMEARTVLTQTHADLMLLADQPEHMETLMSVRRSFHTLKGGARVVGLADYGEAAWLVERYLNDQIAMQQSLTAKAQAFCETQVRRMKSWTDQLLAQLDQKVVLADFSAIDWQLEALTQSLRELDLEAHSQHVPASYEMAFELPPADLLDLSLNIDQVADAQTKTIGDLQISIPLYQAFLNETDEWSRQLSLALSEWALDQTGSFPNQTVGWAHAITGSSATVGFESCAQLAKLTETLLAKTQRQNSHSAETAHLLSRAADEIGRLLHQFAAGFLRAADSNLGEQLQTAIAAPAWGQTSMTQAPLMPSVDADVKAIFEEESAQLLPELGSALRNWDRAQALRTLHTLKGSARLVGEQTMAEQAHHLESQIEQLDDTPSADELSKILQAYDRMLTPVNLHAEELVQGFIPTGMGDQGQAVPVVSRQQPFVAIPSGETIRVQAQTVDRLVNQTGELMIARSRMEAEMARALRTLSDMGTQVQRLRDQLREMELQTESQMQSRQALVADAANNFDPLELDRFTRTQELTRFMAEALSDVSTLQRSLQRSLNTAEDDLAAQLRQTRDLQRNLLRTRMVEFDSATERLHRLVRLTSSELGKSVELNIQNGSQEMDRSVLERMLPVFEHLLRNAVVHGIEHSNERVAKGKAAQGQIAIQLSQQSNDVIVNLQDDGRGIDHEALLLKARQRTGQSDLNADPAELIFMSGLSAAPEVSELAGRGIGMDVVRSQVLALGGRIEVGTIAGMGTSFKLILPLTTAVTQIVLVRTGSHMTGIPGNLVSTIVRVRPENILEAHHSKTFVHAEQNYPFFGLSQLLQYKMPHSVMEQATQNVMLLQSTGQTIAVHVDEVLGNQEVMVKNLGVQLAQMPGLSGMTVLATGPTVFIYNPVALAAVYGPRVADMPIPSMEQPEEEVVIASTPVHTLQAPLVMVVDDSITMRRVLQRLLQREGYRVAVAADGRQALDMLRLELPKLVLSDVEMPRMDGFELLRSIRATDRLADLPVVMITSRIADKHREHAKELGANEYLGKPYSEDELLQLLERYAAKQSAEQGSV